MAANQAHHHPCLPQVYHSQESPLKIPFQQYWDLLAKHIRPQKERFLLLTALLLGSIGMQLVNPQIMRFFIDTTQTGHDTRILLWAALAFIAVALIQQVVGVGATYLGENVAWTATNALRAEMARHCLNLDMSYHNNVSPGELIERIDGDVAELSNFFSQLVIRVLGNILLLLGILVALLLEDWRIGLSFSVFAILTLAALNAVRGIAIPHQKKFREAIADLFGYLEERLAGTEDIRSSGAVEFVLLGLYKLSVRILGFWRAVMRRFMLVRLTAGMLMTVGIGMALASSFYLFGGGLISLGTAYLVVTYTGLLRRPIRELTQQVENLQNIGAATERLRELRAIEAKIVDGPGAEIPAGALSLAFDDVHFAYKEGETVLEQIDFQLQPGTVMGLLGRTGSGKTTLARLVFRLYDPTQGQVSLGGVPLTRPRLKTLRERVALVTQDVQLFQATVRDNITFFNRAIPDSRIVEVIAALGLNEWLERLPNGLDTKLETGGRSISAGEAQLLAFTRVFLRDPGLVILDEASSRLDPATEQLIERAIDRLLENRTAIIIAHRLGTLHRTSEVMILEDGCVIECGNRLELAANPATHFHSLLRTGMEEVLV
jgi:ABC-type multidrug transport system fused ATPase/permease subunit